jgi:hypothetical protein
MYSRGCQPQPPPCAKGWYIPHDFGPPRGRAAFLLVYREGSQRLFSKAHRSAPAAVSSRERLATRAYQGALRSAGIRNPDEDRLSRELQIQDRLILNRGCSFEKPETRVAADDLDTADVFDHIPRTGITPHRGLPNGACAIRVHTGTHRGLEEAFTNSVGVCAPTVFLNEANIGHYLLSRRGAGRLNFNTAKSLRTDR